MMVNLIKNEFVKLFKRKKLITVLLLGIVICGLVVLGVYSINESQKQYMDMDQRIENLESYVEESKDMLENDDLSDEEIQEIQIQITSNEKYIEELKSQIAMEDVEDYEAQLLNEKEKYQSQIDISSDKATINDMQASIDEIDYYLENDIKPFGGFDLDAFSVLLSVLSIVSVLFFPIITVIAGADMVSSEFSPATIKTMLIRPVSRTKILFAKYISMIIMIVGYILVCCVLVVLAGGIIWGFGSGLEPHTVSMNYTFETTMEYGLETVNSILVPGSYAIIPRWQYLIANILFIILANIVLGTFAFALSNLIRKSALNIVISVGTIIGGIIVLELFSRKAITKFFFMKYMNIDSLWSGSQMIQYSDPNMTVLFGGGILVATMVVFLIASTLLFTKREISN